MRGRTARTAAPLVAIALLTGGVVGLQAARERLVPRLPTGVEGETVLYVRSPELMARAALSYRSVLADVYWVRALQHYGRTRLSVGTERRYDLLYPLLDLTTSLDPMFVAAYRFGAIFLTEPPPGGPGRPDLAMALLEKGLEAQPQRWEFAQDLGFVHYRNRDFVAAGDWFERASRIPDAPNWMAPLVAVTRSQGGARNTSRQLWHRIVESAGPDEDWLRRQAQFRLQQLDAMDQMDAIGARVKLYQQRSGSWPRTWADLARARYLAGIPVDPRGFPYELNADGGLVTLNPASTLNPLPTQEPSVR